LALERRSPIKHEYDNGSIVAMSGASRRHNLIAFNLSRELGAQLKDRPCEGYIGDMRVLVEPTGLYTYPDVVVVCGEPRFLDNEFDTLLNPTVIVEILSPSTETDDRTRKTAHYRRLALLREYVLIAQDRVLVEHYVRDGEEWSRTDLTSVEDELRLSSIEARLSLLEVYLKALPQGS
jgi:Uma2 family endonuclease